MKIMQALHTDLARLENAEILSCKFKSYHSSYYYIRRYRVRTHKDLTMKEYRELNKMYKATFYCNNTDYNIIFKCESPTRIKQYIFECEDINSIINFIKEIDPTADIINIELLQTKYINNDLMKKIIDDKRKIK
jgi:hypothetical protein